VDLEGDLGGIKKSERVDTPGITKSVRKSGRGGKKSSHCDQTEESARLYAEGG